MARDGWKIVGKRPDGGNDWQPVDDPAPSPAVDACDRTPGEMLAEILRLTNKQLAGLSKLADALMLDDGQLAQLGQVQRLILGHVRVDPKADPMEQREGETDTQYLERLEAMKAKAK